MCIFDKLVEAGESEETAMRSIMRTMKAVLKNEDRKRDVRFQNAMMAGTAAGFVILAVMIVAFK